MTMTVACCGADGTRARRVLGLSHDHVWPNLTALATGDLGQLVAVAEPDARLRARMERLHGGVDLYDHYAGLLEGPDLDAVLVFADNRTSVRLGLQALGRGLPVMIRIGNRLSLTIEHEGREATGGVELNPDQQPSLDAVEKVLRPNIGQPIKAISDLDV